MILVLGQLAIDSHRLIPILLGFLLLIIPIPPKPLSLTLLRLKSAFADCLMSITTDNSVNNSSQRYRLTPPTDIGESLYSWRNF